MKRFAWSVLVMVFSAASFNIGGFFIGKVLGLVGGAIAYGSKT